ncbi:uncharacterized protein LOC117181518 isoform X2 [Belonocnema kinseyi]|uniref:uncharacterized protein LOC117181518 isoform X1 n=1 Tax=Belonocnema kinseyi TaxID=2817044 RepID=UPI00143DAFD9|nr:uncharacterized protein LOC117181518 isoform X1 [Belonocnema kinseyi]XP_033230175.1 uncharacterized protein LOC117181518 isoform X2 [Belonocnema kinseyi]
MASFIVPRPISQFLDEIPDEKEILKDVSSGEENDFDPDPETVSDCDYPSEQEASSDSEDENLELGSYDEYFLSRDKSCKWEKQNHIQTLQESNSANFLKPESSAIQVSSEIDAFLKLIDDKMLNSIVINTNHKINIKRNQYKRDRDAQNVTKNELLALFGLLFLIGVNKGNHTGAYELWTTDGTGIAMLRACMSNKRFSFLLRHLRFDDEKTSKRKIDKLSPIRFFLDSFIANCKSSYTLGQFVTVKKLDIFQGQSSSLIRKKLASGIKLFVMCDALTYFTSNLEVCAKQPDGPYQLSNRPADVVERLVAPVEGSNRNLTIGSWYTSYSLARALLRKKITSIGTVSKNKPEVPLEFSPNRKKAVGSSVFGFREDATMVSYVPKPNRSVILLSTMNLANIVDEKSKKPLIALHYDMSKGAVDAVDMLCKAYFVDRDTSQWPLALFFTLLNIASVNAQILYESNREDCRVIRKKFLKNLALSLMKNHLSERAKILTLPTEIRAVLAKYRVETVEKKENLESRKRGRCHLCTRTRNVCTTIRCRSCVRFTCRAHVETTAVCFECKYEKNDEDM